jgi:hypothetical protein
MFSWHVLILCSDVSAFISVCCQPYSLYKYISAKHLKLIVSTGKPYIELRNWHGRIHLGLVRLGDEPIAMAAGKTWNVTVWFENLP